MYKKLLLWSITFVLLSCGKKETHLYHGRDINDMIEIAQREKQLLCIAVLDSTYGSSNIYRQRLSEKYTDITANAVFNTVDVNIPANSWYREWLYPVSLPATCIFDLSSDTLKLMDIIPGATHECFDAISQCIKKRKPSSLRYINRFSLEKDVIIPALGKIFRCKISLDSHKDISREIDETLETVQYPYNWYLKALNAHKQGNDSVAVFSGNKMLAFDSIDDIELYSGLYSEVRAVTDKDYSVENEPVLTLDKYHVNLGNCEPNVPKAFGIRFTNTGKRPLEIKDIVLSCDCVSLKHANRFSISPQDSVTVNFEFSSDTQGDVEREVKVYSNGTVPVEKIKIAAYVKQTDEVSQSRFELNLRAPGGEMISSDPASFREEVSSVLEKKYGEKKEFEIISLDYEPGITEGYLVNIGYKTYDGITGSFFRTNLELSVSGRLVIHKSYMPRLKNGTEDVGGGSTAMNLECQKSPNNQCEKCSKIVRPTPNGLQITCQCDQGQGLSEGCELVLY
jgi:hypothetical protein